MQNEITLRRFFDAHCHFRRDERMPIVLPYTASYCRYGLAMPNTRPRAILNGVDVILYRDELYKVLNQTPYKDHFEPIMTIQITDGTTAEVVELAAGVGARAVKVYPKGVTTNSDNGLTDFRSERVGKVWQKLSDLGVPVLIHGERDGHERLVTAWERAFLPTLNWLAKEYPSLKIVLEHVSSEAAVRAVWTHGPNVYATITAHHLYLTLNDVIGSAIRPHNGCMPMPKDFMDRYYLIKAATSGDPKFFLGSDTAPHWRDKKECEVGACGVFTAPILPALLAQIFEEKDKLHNLEKFTSINGCRAYGLEPSTEMITLRRQRMKVPKTVEGIVPFMAGETLDWSFSV